MKIANQAYGYIVENQPYCYTYCLNNPLVYTDPDGEWFGIDDAIVAGVGFIFGYVYHGATTGDWGKDAIVNGAIGAVSSWLFVNTAGAASGLLLEAGLSQGASTVLGNAIGGGVANFTGNIAGQAYFNGSVDMNQAGMAGLYGFGAGLGAGLVDISPLATMDFPMHHTVKHMARSTAYEIGGNLFSGQPLFEDLSYGLNPGLVLPLALDVTSISTSLVVQHKMNKRNESGSWKIGSATFDIGLGEGETCWDEFNENGDRIGVCETIPGCGINLKLPYNFSINNSYEQQLILYSLGTPQDYVYYNSIFQFLFRKWW